MALKNEKGLFIKNPDRQRIPRKLKKQIPKNTHYCYSPIKFPCDENNWKYEIKCCPFYGHIKIKDMKPYPDWMDEEFINKYGEETTGWCKLIKYEIEDQCKSCGINQGKW